MWPGDMFLYEHAWFHQLIQDGEGGFILHTGAGDPNYLYRLNGEGDLLWTHENVSWNSFAVIIPGEPGFFYLGYKVNDHNYGQRMDIEGNFYWPHYPAAYGAPMDNFTGMIGVSSSFCFNYPCFLGAFVYRYNGYFYKLRTNILDLDGNALFGEYATPIALSEQEYSHYSYLNCVPSDEYGEVSVYQLENNIYAKRINFDGTLGGPNVPIDDVTILASGDDIILSWPEMTENAEYYIYKSDNPYTFPPDPFATVENDTVWTDTGAVTEGTGYYDVRWEPRD